MKKFYYLLKCLIRFTFKIIILKSILLINFLAIKKNLLLKIIKTNYFLLMKKLILLISKKENRFLNNRLFFLNKFILNKF
tara:strand:+ start:254 stop:493 length:240 start_codon:yes stop_codon:yes gene_type:complete